MTDLIRVRDTATGHHITVSAALAERYKSRYVELKQDATDRDGRPLPPRHKTALSGTRDAGATRAERPAPDADAPAPVEATTATNTTAKATEEAQK